MEEIGHTLLEQLNDSQRAAVEFCEGPSLVIAGAGSGKTRVLTYKVAYLIECGLAPWNILALTFTNKAAREMRERITVLVGESRAAGIRMGTFHSVFSRILRVEAGYLGYAPNFTIYDSSDSVSLIKKIIRDMGLDDKQYKASSVAARISRAKDRLILADDYANDRGIAEEDRDRDQPALGSIYQQYAARCRSANVMDFDDLLVNTYLLFDRHREVLSKYQDRLRYVLVDEYQDTNYVQQAIILQLTLSSGHVCVVGDDAQSIYAFRGANIDNILGFQKHFSNARLFKLEQNYRSTQSIVAAANSLIQKNARQIPKNIFSTNAVGEKLIVKGAQSDREEAAIVCHDILRLRRKADYTWSSFAILYRTNAQSRSFEEYMRRNGIPYRIYGGLSFYQRKEIKDIIAYFRLVCNPADEEALRRIINYPTRGIGATTLNKLLSTAAERGVSAWSVVCESSHAKVRAFRMMIEGWRLRAISEDAYHLGRDIIQGSGIAAEVMGSRDIDDLARRENIEELFSAMEAFVQGRIEEGNGGHVLLGDFLQEVSLLTDLDSDDGGDDKVSLMTIHSAKGLEFPTVFVVGLEENIFPSSLAANSLRELEEERRLLYVAVTRAREHCFLTFARSRFRYGHMESSEPSRFFKDFGADVLSYSGWAPVEARSVRSVPSISSLVNNSVRPRTAPASFVSVKEGDNIRHERFGIGVVIRVEGEGENTKATISFRACGTKQLLLRFARYEVLK